MRIRFLLGPAGSGKTHRCLDEIRAELLRDPAGAPLLLLAPKQSTFQLERALLEAGGLPGWSRLQILSFDRLARQILGESGPVDLLSEEGRLMVLRAMLRERHGELRVFRSSARLAGFAQELSTLLRELQSHHLGPTRLEELARRVGDTPVLADKLHDLALLLRGYRERLAAQSVIDADRLADLAADALRRDTTAFGLEALWLDGFAEMTPQEIGLLAAVAARARRTTLAFCVDREYPGEAPWLSTWSVVSRTLRRCHASLAANRDARIDVEVLPDRPARGRFASQPALAHLAATWTTPRPAAGEARDRAAEAIRLVACRDAEREAVVAAREIRRHVRRGGRYRDTAVLLRSLDADAPVWRRVLGRFDIPVFVDRREPLAHHPIAELTRGALRLAAFDWPAEDWFAVLKTGLTPVPPDRVDAWENLALARGWDGAAWRRAPEEPPAELADATPLLTDLVEPFRRFGATVLPQPSGRTLAAAIRRLWEDLGVRRRLDTWGEAAETDGPSNTSPHPAIHALHRAAWEQLGAWLDSLELGFGDGEVALADWLPVIEAGLSALTAGVIPPAQDQVVVGAIDRSRQPELALVIVAGLNEGVFPAVPRDGGLLSEVERDRLVAVGAELGPDRLRRVGHERFYGYIACTRAAARLVLTWSQRDARGRPLAPSPFVSQVLRVFPDLTVGGDDAEEVPADVPATVLADRVVHSHEALPWLLARPEPTPIDGLAGDAVRRAWLRRYRSGPAGDRLAPAAVRGLHGVAPEITVSAVESLAGCPFQFFAEHGLQGKERARLEVDPRQTGTLAHQLLARFHLAVTRSGRRWRDVAPAEARTMVATEARALIASTAHGLFDATPEARWQAELLAAGVGECVATLVGWMSSYDFDPEAAELGFGGRAPLPAWSPDPADRAMFRLRGTVDRVDVHRHGDGSAAFTVLDYKLRPPRFDEVRAGAGVDVQLPVYALALADLLPRLGLPDVHRAIPAGMFYVGLRGRPAGGATRRELPGTDDARREIHTHRGRFCTRDADALDRTNATGPSGQFALSRNKDGSVRRGGDARNESEFDALLAGVRETLHRLDALLRSGAVAPAPYRHAGRTACDGCRVAAVCRFDPWLQPFRSLKAPSP